MLRTGKGRPDSTARHVLQVLAEHARPDGSNTHPSVLRIQYRTGYDERTVQRALRRLEKSGLIQRDGSVGGRTKWRLALSAKRPAFDWAELEAEAEDAKKQAAERQRRSRQRRVTPPESVTVTHGESVTKPDVTHSDDVTEECVTHSESVSHALEMRDVTHSASACHALSAPLTTNNHQSNHQEPSAWPEVANEPAATAAPEDDANPEPVTAQTVVGEWLARAAKRPPSSVIGQVAKHIRVLLDEDRIDPDDIRRGIAHWMAKGLHPSTLPSVVNQVMNTTPTPTRTSAATAPGFDPNTGTDIFDRALARANARTQLEGQ
ncbi:helix-turn-helix domain-containing protein [Streptomyces sp. NBC_00464]|uniref:helix-turn-helix domain-containing protein n=1 Tax=Streptomyces sp. NBC_00464 TaxID=2975751 RepID=UPI002E16B5DB